MATPTLSLGLPQIHATTKHNKSTPPTNDFLTGTWHVTHSSLPLWKNKRNVQITYTALPAQSGITKLDDRVQYQASGSDKIKSVHGVDTPSRSNQGAWDWRGKGWLVIASSHWECLGFGREDDGNEWVVTYFAKTLFTPAGIDVYSRRRAGLGEGMVERILGVVRGFGVLEMQELADAIFEIPRD
ncbi:uncharacterized protein N7482_008185 [Penicillium canariense]|uniref:Uncharacterized protein n=1 Tax=Penicillium canariense TaxID=189055 RepID=A0A9W9HVI0_9EURO|nr:uncharacterized protein N7482_008185 [Penicillium canariense]KAJ5157085.1 hypothetical protein N7482_008185 [Penicillium canariense]